MYQNMCKSCGSIDLFTKEKGNQVGLYCADCGKWIKWLSKEELNAFNHHESLVDITVGEEWLKKHDKQIRADERAKVTEEILDIVKDISLSCGSPDTYDCIGHCEKCDCAVVETYEIDSLIKQINQLKEQTE